MNKLSVLGCCDDGHRIDLSKMTFSNPLWYVCWDKDFTLTALSIIIYPIYWITVSQWEHRRGVLRGIFSNSYNACGMFTMTLLPLALYRNCRFMATVRRQPYWWVLRQNPVLWTGHASIVLGVILVICSFYQLGLWITLLGDFFGISDGRSSLRGRFPYTWFYHPMYWGACFIFFGLSLVMASQAGLLLTLFAILMYRVAIYFEHDHFYKIHHVPDKDRNGKKRRKRGDADDATLAASDGNEGQAGREARGEARHR